MRTRIVYLVAAIAVIAIGLLTRMSPALPWALAKPLGSALWGAMVYCLIRAGRPHALLLSSTIVAAALAAAVEFSQLWHTAWLDYFRSTPIGALLIGRYF